MQKYNLQKKNPLKETKILQDIITLELMWSFNTSQNIIFQKSSYKNRPTTWVPKSLKQLYSYNESKGAFTLGVRDSSVESPNIMLVI
jgi:hypothetical protein